MHALRGERYKYIRYHGIWDINELYDLQEDPLESHNLIFSEKHQAIIQEMNHKLFQMLEDTGGMSIPLYPDRGGTSNLRNPAGPKAADFPPELVRERKPNQ
jgi:N-acetylglucosamine-6-sulfatase